MNNTANEGTDNMKKKTPSCTCLIKHAVTKEEREHAKLELKYSREVGDSVGIMLTMMSLTTQCPSVKA